MAKEPIKVFGLGSGGVNLVKDPLEMADNELVRCQNAEPFQDRGRFGLRKRAGLDQVVPTGTVDPSAAGGPVLGGFIVDDPLGYPSIVPEEVTRFGGPGYYSNDGGTTWTTYTPGQTMPDANIIYDLTGTYDANLTPLFPPVWLDGIYFFGGRASGQVLAAYRTKAALGGLAHQLVVREATRVVATGSVNDTYVLPTPYNTLGTAWLVISLSGGGVQLYDPVTGTVRRLPTLGATATGCAQFAGKLWVVAGLSLYSMDPFVDSAWTTAATVADAGIAALTGLAQYKGNLYSGTRTNATQPVRVYKFAPTGLGTATATTSASVQQIGSPAYMWGPYPSISNDTLMNVVYFGSAAIFVTLIGSAGDAESMTGASTRILTFDGTLWHNGVDTNTENLALDFWENSSDVSVGPITNAGGGRYRILLARYVTGPTRKLSSIGGYSASGANWSASTASGTSLPVDAFEYPALEF